MFGSPLDLLRSFAALNDDRSRRERRARERARKAALRSGNPARREAAREGGCVMGAFTDRIIHLYATTPPPVTMYGVQFADGDIELCADYDDAIDLCDGCNEPGAQIVTVTGRVRPE